MPIISAVVSVTSQPDRNFTATDDALEAMRFAVNPSLLERVTRLKALAALFWAECASALAENPIGAREFAIAKTKIQEASMWGVSGATNFAAPHNTKVPE